MSLSRNFVFNKLIHLPALQTSELMSGVRTNNLFTKSFSFVPSAPFDQSQPIAQARNVPSSEKSAQVIGWPDYWIWSSFLIVGLVVALCSIASYFLAKQIGVKLRQPKWMLFDFGQWIQLSVISYFGLLALLRYTFEAQWLWWKLLMVSFVLMAMILHRIAIKTTAANDREEKAEENLNSVVSLPQTEYII